jgi:hypothetical protein
MRPSGPARVAGAEFLAPHERPGALVTRNSNGRTWFSVNDHSGPAFQNHDGFFEFDVSVQ